MSRYSCFCGSADRPCRGLGRCRWRQLHGKHWVGGHIAHRRQRHVRIGEKANLRVLAGCFHAQNPSDIVVELKNRVGYRPGEKIFIPLQVRQFFIHVGLARIDSVLDGQGKVLVLGRRAYQRYPRYKPRSLDRSARNGSLFCQPFSVGVESVSGRRQLIATGHQVAFLKKSAHPHNRVP